jgi:hypothetical protein
MHQRIEEALAGEALARKQVGDGNAERKAHRDAPQRNAQAEEQDVGFFGGEHGMVAYWPIDVSGNG